MWKVKHAYKVLLTPTDKMITQDNSLIKICCAAFVSYLMENVKKTLQIQIPQHHFEEKHWTALFDT